MSCATAVMYQPYSSYNINSSPSTSSMPPQGFHTSPDRVPPPPPPPQSLIEDNNNRSHLENKHHMQQVFKVEHLHSTLPQDLSSYQPPNGSNTSSSNSQSSPPPSRPPSHLNQHDEDSSDSTISAHRLSSNIVVFTHYVGDASSVVEDHFSRALNSYERDETPYKPMSARNLPASFWTAPSPRHSALSSSRATTACNLLNQSSAPPYGDLYPESITGALHQLAADWQYPHSSVGHTPSNPSSSYSSNYSNYTARFQSGNYWSPRLVGSSSTTSSVKSEWSPEPPYSDFSPHPHHPPHHPYHHYSNIAAVAAAGLESNSSSDASSVNKPHHPPPAPATSTTDLFWTTTF